MGDHNVSFLPLKIQTGHKERIILMGNIVYACKITSRPLYPITGSAKKHIITLSIDN
jgi:hypothetical protein